MNQVHLAGLEVREKIAKQEESQPNGHEQPECVYGEELQLVS